MTAKEGERGELCLENFGRSLAYKPVLHGIHLNLRAGDLACLLGANGAGKSTLLSSLCAPRILYSGRLFFEGKEIKGARAHRHFSGHCSYLGHKPGLFYDLLVSENIDFFSNILSPSLSSKIPELQERKENLLEITGLKKYRKKKVGLLSRGLQQKLALARCFLRLGTGERQVYLLDEPLNSLDAKGIDILFYLLDKAKKEGSIAIVSSHNEDFFYSYEPKGAPSLATQFIVLKEGRIRADIPARLYNEKTKAKLRELL